jgi:hypothetical protein
MFSFQVHAREESQRRLYFYVAANVSNHDTLRGRLSDIDTTGNAIRCNTQQTGSEKVA